MTFELTREQEAELTQLAALRGRVVDELVRYAVDRYLTEEARYQVAFEAEQGDGQYDDLIVRSPVWARVERQL